MQDRLQSPKCKMASNLNSDFAIENKIFRSILDQPNLRLQSERSTSEGGSFSLVTESGFRFSFHLNKLGSRLYHVVKKAVSRSLVLLWIDQLLVFCCS